MQVTGPEMAFLYAFLATVGVATPVSHSRHKLESIRSPESQAKYLRNAKNMLDDLEDVPESTGSIIRCQTLTLLSWYHQGKAEYNEGWSYIQQAIAAAYQCNLFAIGAWDDAIPAKQLTVKMLQMDISFIFHWSAYSQGSLPPSRLVAPPSLGAATTTSPPSNPLDQELLCFKAKGSALAYRISLECQRSIHFDAKDLLRLALQLDDKVLHYMDSHSVLRNVPPFLCIDSSNHNAVRLADSVLLFRGNLMRLRYRMMLSFYERSPLDVFQSIALSSARTILQMLSLV
jgi:hypothetical protein